MPVKGKVIAFAGLALALTVLLMMLGAVLEWNTLFFLGAASFFVGIMIREFGLRLGAAFYVAAVFLGFILAPNKLYCITFAAMGFYIIMAEWSWRLLEKRNGKKNRRLLFWMMKYAVFNVMFVPFLFLFPKLIFPGTPDAGFLALIFAGGQAALWIYDKAYEYFQAYIWGKYRDRIIPKG